MEFDIFMKDLLRLNKFFLPILLLLVSCGGSSNENADSASKMNNSKKSNSQKGFSSKYTNKLDLLLDLQLASSISGMPEDKVEKEYDSSTENPTYHTINYLWDMGREKEMNNPIVGTMKIPTSEKVIFGKLQDMSMEHFQAMHGVKSEEEKQKALDAMSEGVEKRLADKGMDESAKELAKNMAAGFILNMKREEVKGVGDAAVWDFSGSGQNGELHVLYKGTKFSILLDLPLTFDEHKAKSIELALKIIEKLD